MVGIRDPYTIAQRRQVIGWARDKVRERFGENGYELHYTVYGRNGVMGELEPLKHRPAHELCILVQGVAPTAEMAEEVCMTGTRQMFYARLPDVKGSAGGVAFALDEVLRASPAHRWTSTTRCAATTRWSCSRPELVEVADEAFTSSQKRSAARTPGWTSSPSTSSSATACPTSA